MLRPSRLPSAAPPFTEPLWSCWLMFMAPLVPMAIATVLAHGAQSISDLFFLEQDAVVALVMTATLRLLPYAPRWTPPAPWPADRTTVFALAVLTVLIAYGGVWLV